MVKMKSLNFLPLKKTLPLSTQHTVSQHTVSLHTATTFFHMHVCHPSVTYFENVGVIFDFSFSLTNALTNLLSNPFHFISNISSFLQIYCYISFRLPFFHLEFQNSLFSSSHSAFLLVLHHLSCFLSPLCFMYAILFPGMFVTLLG